MEWLSPQTKEQAADNVEAAHEDHDDGCSCVYRMRAALAGLPDPEGVGYQWPVLHYGCIEAPKYGCMTIFEAVTERIMADIYRNHTAQTEVLLGLSAAIP